VGPEPADGGKASKGSSRQKVALEQVPARIYRLFGEAEKRGVFGGLGEGRAGPVWEPALAGEGLYVSWGSRSVEVDGGETSPRIAQSFVAEAVFVN
jgi:hypothetical protein